MENCGGCRRTHTLPSVPSGPIPRELNSASPYGKVQLTEVSHHLFALPIVALAWRERYQSRNGGSRHNRSAPRQPNGNGNQVVLDGLAEPKTDYSNEDLVGLSSIRD